MSRIPALTASLTNRVVGAFTGRLAATPEPVVSQDPPERLPGGLFEQGILDSYNQMLARPAERRQEMRFYDHLERELEDVPKALDAYAVMACTGSVTGSNAAFQVRMPDNSPDDLKAWMRMYEDVVAAEQIPIVRGMCQYGSYPAELVIGEREISGRRRLAVVDINHQPPGTMYRNLSGGHEKYWNQCWMPQQVARQHPRWATPHFAMWQKVVNAELPQLYGLSILAPVGRVGLQLLSSTDGMVVARMQRAAMRYAITVDISDVSTSQEKMQDRLNFARKLFSRKRQAMANSAFDSYQRAPVPDEDFFIPGGKSLAWKVDKIEGDMNLGNIQDIEFLLKRYFAALGVPPAYLGQGQDSGGRSSLSQVDIHFARTSRAVQVHAAGGFLHGAIVHMILGGWDPDQYPPRIEPASIGARDELIDAQVTMLKSQIVANLAKAGLDPSEAPRWVLNVLMGIDAAAIEGLSDAELNKLFKSMPEIAMKTGTATSVQRPGSRESRDDQNLHAAIARGTDQYVANVRALLAMDVMPNEHIAYRRHPNARMLRDEVLA